MITITGHCKQQGKKAYTLVEIIVSMAIGSLALAMLGSGYVYFTKGVYEIANISEINHQSSLGLEYFALDARSATDVPVAEAAYVEFSNLNGIPVIYEYDSDNGLITRQEGIRKRTLITDVQSSSFKYFTLRGDETTNPLEIKKIQLDAEIIKHVGGLNQVYKVISARYMIRNKPVSN